jgi:prepilin-type N-terminal cleavage/methylation domain-containing protein
MNRGFTIAEMIIVVAIAAALIAAFGKFQADTFSFNRVFQAGMTVNRDAERVVKVMASEIRSMSPASNGAYPIEAVATSSITFFNDIDNDGSKERIRYYLDFATRTFKKGVVKPTGSPLTYNLGSETQSNLLENVRATTSPIFTYYDTGFTGTSSPLAAPVDILRIRLVKINIALDVDPNQAPVPIDIMTYVTPRNLKDNL